MSWRIWVTELLGNIFNRLKRCLKHQYKKLIYTATGGAECSLQILIRMSCAHSESKEMPHQIISSTEYSYKKRHIMNHQRAWRIKRLFSSIRNISKKYYISSNYVMHTTLLLCSYTERVIICRQLPFHYSWLRSLHRVWEKRKCHENRK